VRPPIKQLHLDRKTTTVGLSGLPGYSK